MRHHTHHQSAHQPHADHACHGRGGQEHGFEHRGQEHGFVRGGHQHGFAHPEHEHRGHRGHERGRRPSEQPRGGARPHPTLERGIVKAARRIRRSGLTPEQLQHRIAGAGSHADYVTTMRTLRRIGMELREVR